MRPIFRTLVLVVVAILVTACGTRETIREIVVVTATSAVVSPTKVVNPSSSLQSGGSLGSVVAKDVTVTATYGIILVDGQRKKTAALAELEEKNKEIVKILFQSATYTWSSGQKFEMVALDGAVEFQGTCNINSETKLITCTAEKSDESEGITLTTNVKWEFDFSTGIVHVSHESIGSKEQVGLGVVVTFDQRFSLVK